MGRPFLTPYQHGFYIGLITLENSLHRTIRFVPYPTVHAVAPSSTLGLHPEKDTLDPAGDDGVGSNLVFHVLPPKKVLETLRAAWRPGCWEAF
jgi:hypothetical protein